ncbi:unnamed protein product [Plutella xylostella]|uniref:(diamondback moth) hypothetical protein n=1 Tax=Plutella xylostella TaxID=51655 RepID=A0A8S4E2E4_PLUXY|nr:unnamed protein product [Plutella xylostella]
MGIEDEREQHSYARCTKTQRAPPQCGPDYSHRSMPQTKRTAAPPQPPPPSPRTTNDRAYRERQASWPSCSPSLRSQTSLTEICNDDHGVNARRETCFQAARLTGFDARAMTSSTELTTTPTHTLTLTHTVAAL